MEVLVLELVVQVGLEVVDMTELMDMLELQTKGLLEAILLAVDLAAAVAAAAQAQ